MAKSRAVAADRAISKASAHYKNSEWDIVDAATSEVIDLGNRNSDDLPSGMQNMNVKEREAYVRKTEKKRHELKSGINTLNEERKAHILKKQKENQSGTTLDSALINSVREQVYEKILYSRIEFTAISVIT